MSEASERLKRERSGIIDSLSKSFEKNPPPSWPWGTILVLIFCTMLPVDTISMFFSIAAVVAITAFLTATYQNILTINKKTAKALAIMTFGSIISGCTPALFSKGMPEFFDMGAKGTKVYTLQRIGILGFGLGDATVEQARLEGQFKKVIASREERGYGLISVARITIAGKS